MLIKNVDGNLEKLQKYQNNVYVHPLTCLNGCGNLTVKVSSKNYLYLCCDFCQYVQVNIPEAVLSMCDYNLDFLFEDKS